MRAEPGPEKEKQSGTRAKGTEQVFLGQSLVKVWFRDSPPPDKWVWRFDSVDSFRTRVVIMTRYLGPRSTKRVDCTAMQSTIGNRVEAL